MEGSAARVKHSAARVKHSAARVKGSAAPTYWPVHALSVAIFGVYASYALARQATLLTAGYDLGIFDQAVRDYSRFRAPIVPVKGGDYNIFADHFHPIIATAAPLYWIWDSPCVLLILQAALVSGSIPVVHSFAARRIGPRAALAVAVAYALGWAFQAMIDFDFHEVAFAVPMLAVAIDALDREDDRTLLVASGLLLLVREDMGAVLVMIGLLRLLRRPRWQWPGLALMGSGVGVYLLVTSIVIPHFASGGFAYWTFDALGPDVPHVLLSVVGHPVHAVKLIFTPSVKAQTLAYLFLPLLFLPLLFLPLRSRYLLIAVPLLAERFFNSRDYLWTTHYHYSALSWVVLTLAMVDGATRLGVWSAPRLRAATLVYLLLVPVFLLVRPSVTPAVFQRMINGKAWRVTSHGRDAKAAIHQIPGNVCVSLDDRLVPQLTNRNRVSEPGLRSAKTDFVVLDMSQKDVGYLQPSPQAVLDSVRGRGFTVVFSRGDFLVLKSPAYAGASRQCRP